ncbi:Hypothetical protein ACGLYG10_2861 [Actinomyces glycerinitolerans]|uniref:Uncharacterized protein n=1 Tax=Actinomyces glycerinitolerans TaxID=1892869 RepID=A0A1M4S395_9ACTO|nr:Hypothetical protein ACGLYG10_2861 [Actinomyces glycerinitolerans]
MLIWLMLMWVVVGRPVAARVAVGIGLAAGLCIGVGVVGVGGLRVAVIAGLAVTGVAGALGVGLVNLGGGVGARVVGVRGVCGGTAGARGVRAGAVTRGGGLLRTSGPGGVLARFGGPAGAITAAGVVGGLLVGIGPATTSTGVLVGLRTGPVASTAVRTISIARAGLASGASVVSCAGRETSAPAPSPAWVPVVEPASRASSTAPALSARLPPAPEPLPARGEPVAYRRTRTPGGCIASLVGAGPWRGLGGELSLFLEVASFGLGRTISSRRIDGGAEDSPDGTESQRCSTW